MVKHLVHLNNEHSRAPLRPKDARQRRRGPPARPVSGRRLTRSAMRARPAKDAFAD
jgi:hypothetical protein